MASKNQTNLIQFNDYRIFNDYVTSCFHCNEPTDVLLMLHKTGISVVGCIFTCRDCLDELKGKTLNFSMDELMEKSSYAKEKPN